MNPKKSKLNLEIKKILSNLKHPEINNSLIELGMIGKIEQENKKISIELKFPVAEVPIKQMIANLIIDKLKDYNVNVIFSLMNENEKNKFFNLAQQNWAL